MATVNAPIKQFGMSTNTRLQTSGSALPLCTPELCVYSHTQEHIKFAGVMTQKTRSVHIAASYSRCDIKIRGGGIKRGLLQLAINCNAIHWDAEWDMRHGRVNYWTFLHQYYATYGVLGFDLIFAHGHTIIKISIFERQIGKIEMYEIWSKGCQMFKAWNISCRVRFYTLYITLEKLFFSTPQAVLAGGCAEDGSDMLAPPPVIHSKLR